MAHPHRQRGKDQHAGGGCLHSHDLAPLTDPLASDPLPRDLLSIPAANHRFGSSPRHNYFPFGQFAPREVIPYPDQNSQPAQLKFEQSNPVNPTFTIISGSQVSIARRHRSTTLHWLIQQEIFPDDLDSRINLDG
jgi:hypothetical protein